MFEKFLPLKKFGIDFRFSRIRRFTAAMRQRLGTFYCMVRFYMNRHTTKPTKWLLRPAKTQISLDIRPVWSVFAVRMKKHWVLSYPLWWRMSWLIWVFAWRTGHFVCFVVLRLICRTRVGPTGRPVSTTGPILHIDLVIWRRTIAWAKISAATSHKQNLRRTK